MAWTSPRTWVTGEVVTAALMNTHVRDNLNHLYNRASGAGSNKLTRSTSTTTTSASYVTITGLTGSITKVSADTYIKATLSASCFLTAYQTGDIRIYDATSAAQVGEDVAIYDELSVPQKFGVHITGKTTALAAGAYTIRAEWRTTGGTFTLNGGELILEEKAI